MSKAKAKTQTPHRIEVPPNARRTMEALREMGYDSQAAIMDLIDNSLDAGASRVDVWIKEVSKGQGIHVEIVDDGRGMDDKTLAEALRLGSDTKHDEKTDLGKFGMGLVTASISMARNIWVLSRQKGLPAYEATLDLDAIASDNKFVIDLKQADGKTVVGSHLDKAGHGTTVRLSRIDRINDTNVARFAANLRTRLGQTYRHFLAKGITILVNNKKVERYDPLHLDHPETERVLDTDLDLGDGTKARFIAVELPDLGTQKEQELNILPHNSGFYVVRNGREIIAGETFGFYRHHHSYSHFRAELSFTGNSTVFHEDIKKASIHPDDRLLDKLRKLTEKLIADSGRRSRDTSTDEPLKLTHKAAQAAINTKFAILAKGPTKEVIEQAHKANGPITLAAPEEPQPETPRKRGRPSKEEAAKRKAEEEAKAKAQANQPKAPVVEFVEVDGGEAGRFYQTVEDKAGNFTVQYNKRHPFVRLVAESKQPRVAAILDVVTFALARAEKDVPEGKKLVNRACDYLAVLAAPTGGK